MGWLGLVVSFIKVTSKQLSLFTEIVTTFSQGRISFRALRASWPFLKMCRRVGHPMFCPLWKVLYLLLDFTTDVFMYSARLRHNNKLILWICFDWHYSETSSNFHRHWARFYWPDFTLAYRRVCVQRVDVPENAATSSAFDLIAKQHRLYSWSHEYRRLERRTSSAETCDKNIPCRGNTVV